MRTQVDRRGLITGAAAATAAVCLGQVTPAVGAAPSSPQANADKVRLTSSKANVEWPRWEDNDATALLDVLNSGRWGRTGGERRLSEFETAFAKVMEAKYCIATSSGTTALLTTLGALGLGPGDEVIMPPYTFVATFNSITNSYALPIFVDSDAESFQIDAGKIERALTHQTKLLLPVHIGGSVADLDALSAIAKSHNLPLIEDACQAPLAQWNGRPVGTHGLAGCFSFQASKNLNCGEGGAVLTDDESFAQRCLNFYTPGGGKQVAGSGRGANYRLTEFQGGLLLAQMTRLEAQSQIRESNAAYLNELLRNIPGITPAKLLAGCTRSAWHLYMFRYDKQHFAALPRADFLKQLGQAGVSASSGYTSLNRSPHVQALATNPHYVKIYGADAMKQWYEAQACPVNDRLCEEAVWLTQTKLLGNRLDMERIAETITKVRNRRFS